MVKIPSPVNVRGVEHCGAGFQISLVVSVLCTDELDGNFLWFFFYLDRLSWSTTSFAKCFTKEKTRDGVQNSRC